MHSSSNISAYIWGSRLGRGCLKSTLSRRFRGTGSRRFLGDGSRRDLMVHEEPSGTRGAQKAPTNRLFVGAFGAPRIPLLRLISQEEDAPHVSEAFCARTMERVWT